MCDQWLLKGFEISYKCDNVAHFKNWHKMVGLSKLMVKEIFPVASPEFPIWLWNAFKKENKNFTLYTSSFPVYTYQAKLTFFYLNLPVCFVQSSLQSCAVFFVHVRPSIFASCWKYLLRAIIWAVKSRETLRNVGKTKNIGCLQKQFAFDLDFYFVLFSSADAQQSRMRSGLFKKVILRFDKYLGGRRTPWKLLFLLFWQNKIFLQAI